MSLEGIFDRILVVGTMIILCMLVALGVITFKESSRMDVGRSNEVVFASSRLVNNLDALRFVAKQESLKDPTLSDGDLSRRFAITKSRVQDFKKGEIHAIDDPEVQKYIGQLDVFIQTIANAIEDPNCDGACRGNIVLTQANQAKRIVTKLQGRGLILDGQMRRSVDAFNASTISHIYIGSFAFMAFTGFLALYMMKKNHALRAKQIELTESQHRLVEVGRYRGQFLAGMSHEFRTPLNAIKGFSQLILMSKAELPRDKLLEYMKDIEKSATDLEALTNSILDLSKIDAGTFDLYEQTIDLVDLLKDVNKQFNAGRFQTAFKFDLPETLPLYCDPIAIKRCVQNLILNAVKFSNADSPVEVSVNVLEHDVQINVRDFGCGIPKKDLESVWKVYSRSSYTRASDKQGSGLGLPIIKALIEAHGGRAKLESEIDAGTTVTLTLPASRLRAQQSVLPKAA